MTPSVLLILFVFHAFEIYGYQIQENDLKYGYLVGLGVNIIFESLWEVIYIIAVSYTHLDVYKRQNKRRTTNRMMTHSMPPGRLRNKKFVIISMI